MREKHQLLADMVLANSKSELNFLATTLPTPLREKFKIGYPCNMQFMRGCWKGFRHRMILIFPHTNHRDRFLSPLE